MKLLLQTKQRLGALEEDLDVPADPVNTDHVLHGEGKIRRQHREPFVLLRAMTDEYHVNRYAGGKLGSNRTKDASFLALHRRRCGV
ncbi:Uncharacterised protein [Streptococcus suis]|nr:Uncharacterised protein [Streptococcus suis]SPX04165.1 Uncharacterised protein [Enterococcus faecium]